MRETMDIEDLVNDDDHRIDKLTDAELLHLLSDAQLRDDIALARDVEQAIAQAKYGKANVERAWSRFQNRYVERRKLRVAHYVAWVSSVAAVALALFVVTRLHVLPEQGLVAFTAKQGPVEIVGGNDGSRTAALTRQSFGEDVVVGSKSADFSKVAASDKKMLYIETPRGKDYQVTLSDGSVVTLNGDSRLVFPKKFSGPERVVKLIGEAYFKIKHNPSCPFVVKAGNLRTRVLGTEFNLKAYPESETHVTLIKGAVAVHSLNNSEEVTLHPGEDLTTQDGSKFDVTAVDTEYYIQWRDGYFYFDNVALVDIMRDLGRWYNMNVVIEDNSLLSYRLHFSAERNKSVKEVVSNLNEFSYLSARMEGNKIIISKK